MRILILGAGQVGSSVAEILASEANDITIVDVDPVRLRELQDRLDLRTVVGNASYPSVLDEAGVRDTDLMLALTQKDETNMVACKLAASLFNVPTRIARVRSREYEMFPDMLAPENFAIDHVINPEAVITEYVKKLIEFPEALQVIEFADGKVSLVAVRAFRGGPLVGNPLRTIREHVPNIDVRVAAIFRGNQSIQPDGDTIIQAGDEVFFLAAEKHIRQVLKELRRMDKPVKRVMIAGGGNIGLRVAAALESDYNVKLVEHDKRRCELLGAELSSALVLHGDATDEDLLEDENVSEMDTFLSLTNDDENNIMSALLAKKMGARRTIALINRRAYGDLMQGGRIDIAISPAQATIGGVLTKVRRGDVVAVHSLRRGAAEVLEIVAHGDAASSRCIAKRIEELELPKGASIACIVRGEEVLMAHHDITIEPEDHLIVFVANRCMISKVEKLFQVGFRFFWRLDVRRLLPVLRVLSVVVMLFAFTLLVPLVVSHWLADGAQSSYDEAFVITIGVGAVMWLISRGHHRELQPRDGILLVALTWTVLPAMATIPLMTHLKDLSFTDAYFETVSGLTTTGATVLTGLDNLPPSINLWRTLLVWVGGMGIIVLTVAILPLIGVGGSQVFRAETPGPMKDAKLTPRITETAKGLYAVYVGITMACIASYWLAGMTPLDAVMHAFSTMGLGGFSSHDDSFAYWNSPKIEVVSVVFMLIAGCNFATHFIAFRKLSLAPYRRDPEAGLFIGMVLSSVLLVALYLLDTGTYKSFGEALRFASFNVVSIATTTGFASTDYDKWPIFAPVWMLFLCMFATCAGSTGGGIKMIRARILALQTWREMTRLIHPRAYLPVKVAGEVVENNVVFAILAFMLVYGLTTIVITLLLAASGLDIVSAFTAVIACVNNTGPGLAKVGPATTYQVLSDFQTWLCTAAMLLGRLELFTLLVLLTPAFWRK